MRASLELYFCEKIREIEYFKNALYFIDSYLNTPKYFVKLITFTKEINGKTINSLLKFFSSNQLATLYFILFKRFHVKISPLVDNK